MVMPAGAISIVELYSNINAAPLSLSEEIDH
jgi:hypothetical protein